MEHNCQVESPQADKIKNDRGLLGLSSCKK